MLKYIKKFYSYITGDEEKDTNSQQELRNVVSHEKKNLNESDIKARVSYQYPERNFRFPLIADSEIQQKGKRRPPRQPVDEKPVTTATSHSVSRPTPVKKKEMPRKVETSKVKVSSGPFKATDVPSPVYGFRERVNPNRENEPVEFELPETTAIPIFQPEENKENTYSNEYINDINEDISEPYEDEIEEYVEEIGELHQSFQTVVYDEVSSTIEEMEEATFSSHPMQEELREEKTPPRKPVPFNVVMLKQDRERLNQKPKETQKETPQPSGYQFPPLHYLTLPKHDVFTDEQWLEEQKDLLDVTLENFNVRAKVVNVTQGPSVTRFEVHPEPGVKVNKITNLSDDIKLSLSARDIRMEAPIPGKNTIGIEVPNKVSKPVLLSEIINSHAFRNNPSPLTVALGLDISGKPIITDLKKMPHGLIAGATGSGKSVCINAMLVSLLYKASPDQVKLLLIDPKMVELAPYNDIPHLVSPVITDVKAATAALKWAVEEMERRYERFAHSGVRDINRYNELVREHNEPSGEMPFLVIIIDELADLMMVAPGEVEESICRIAQKARACGIHLLLATQRPSVDVITGLIKANVPTRIAFSVSSQVDSRTIIDVSGAEKLLGKGDMLLLENGSSKSVRLQGNFVSDQEIEKIVSFVKERQKPEYLFHQQDLVSKSNITHDEDELFNEACEFVIEQGGASSSLLQRRFRIGYNRAARLIEMMEDYGIVSEQRGSKQRDVLITAEEWLELQDENSTSIS
ncbi:DNA translocase FtsK [Bacillus suaedaesalsae]|uniref:DNA translocase FtsK n=1 Tax=Bacillus suaedaesalsae TaxID=2810349 RepID=A0ABS2DD69_9BACI|nr:DNA translocase FtsK [Bacillus suaedaesalsae]MBM6616403.1 DNA translocase FtsK [Bacillus suaedaesalsae]